MKKVTIAIVLLASFSNIFGQSSGSNQSQYDPGIRNVPTSPEVALLGRFGDIPVGHYTGTAEVSVPLYTLKVDNIEIPLALSYHTSGIKVADEATWVGLGWNFMPEGTITQEIRGREDFATGGDGFKNTSGYDGFKSHFPTLYSENQNYRPQIGFSETNDGYSSVLHSPSIYDDSNEIIIRLKEKKGQPDIFSYNFYGYSGKFFYNPDNYNEIVFMESNEDVKFTRNTEGWIATTNKGEKFYFNAIEKSRSNQTDYTDIGYTFKITKIELVSGKVINFYYQDESTYQEYPVEVAHITNFGMSPSVTSNQNVTINDKKTLVAIETEDTRIDFNLSSREDIKPYSASLPVKKLSSIDIKSKFPDRKIKSFVFNTAYFPTVPITTVEEGYKNKRLKLNSIQEVTYTDTGLPVQNIPPHLFEYNTLNIMPSKIATSDFYGYYNGASGGGLLPDLAYFDYFHKPLYKNYGLNMTYPYNGAMRYPSPAYAATNILKKVIYPTGARTEFEYESNTFDNQFIPTYEQVLAASKDITLTHRGASTIPGGYYFLKSEPFKISADRIVKINNTIFDGYMGAPYPQTHYDYYQMLNCKIELHKTKIVNGQSVDTMLKEWKVDVPVSVFEQTHQRVWDEEVQLTYDSDPTTEYYMYVSNGIQYNSNDGTHFAVVSSRLRYFDDGLIDKSISYGHGLRIKSIKNYENSTLLSHKAYTYNSGKLLYNFEPLNLMSGATYKDQATYQAAGCFLEFLAIFNDLSVNSNDFGISGSKPFGYSEVIEKDINVIDTSQKGFVKYKFNNAVSVGTVIKGIPKVDIPSNGENFLIEKYDTNGNKLSSKANTFSNLPNTYNIYPSFSIISTSTGIYDPTYTAYPAAVSGCPIVGTSYTGHTYMNPLPTTKYRFVFNPLITGKRRLTKTIETTYLNGKSMVETTDLSYTPTGELDLSTTKGADGKITQTDYDYAYDVNNTRLVNKGMTGVPLSIEVSQGEVIANTPLSHIETKYDNSGNYLPSSMKSGNFYVSNMDTEVTYDKYDGKGNLLQYTRKDGIPVALIWGYGNTQVIAKVEGATYDQAMALVGSSDIITKSNQDVDAATQNVLISQLDVFRTDNSRQVITTYTYDPLIGVTSITPPSGVREVYVYDSSNRLKQVVDVNGKVLKEYSYHYKN